MKMKTAKDTIMTISTIKTETAIIHVGTLVAVCIIKSFSPLHETTNLIEISLIIVIFNSYKVCYSIICLAHPLSVLLFIVHCKNGKIILTLFDLHDLLFCNSGNSNRVKIIFPFLQCIYCCDSCMSIANNYI